MVITMAEKQPSFLHLFKKANQWNSYPNDILRLDNYWRIIQKAKFMDPKVKGIPKLGIPLEGGYVNNDYRNARWFVSDFGTTLDKDGNLMVRLEAKLAGDRVMIKLPGNTVHFEYYGTKSSPTLLAFFDPDQNRLSEGANFSETLKSGYVIVDNTVDDEDEECSDEEEIGPTDPASLKIRFDDILTSLVVLECRVKALKNDILAVLSDEGEYDEDCDDC